MIETDSITMEKGRLRKFPLAFADPLLETDFRKEYGSRAIKHMKDNYPFVMGTMFIGAIIFFIFQPTAVLVYLTAIVMFGVLAFMGLMLRFFPPSEKGLQIFLLILGISMGWVYSTGVITVADTFMMPYVSSVLAVHVIFMCMCTPLRFSYVINVVLWTSAAYLIISVVFNGYAPEVLLIQTVLGLGIYSFCLINSYQREWLTRIEFIQRMVIEAREKSLAREKERSEKLLLNVLPEPIAEQLKSGRSPIADMFENVSVLFCDICGFTPMAKGLAADEVVEILNEIFHLFDDLAIEYGLEKIKTIGDAYMVAAGIPAPRPDHADAIAKMAIGIRDAVANYSVKSGRELQVRIGINSGPVVAGVIGKAKFAYDMWGDTVNTASRMESHGIPGEIQVASATFELLKGSYEFDARGEIEVKGQGVMETFMLKKACNAS